jgi:hypothetical protein
MVARFEDDLDDLRSCLGHLQLHTKSLVLLPLNNNPLGDRPGGTHWSLLACIRQSEGAPFAFAHLDSHAPANMPIAADVASRFWPLLTACGDSPSSASSSTGPFPGVEESPCPQQTNSSDCGVFTAMFAEQLALGKAPADIVFTSPYTAASAYRQTLTRRIRELAAE